jgi:quercetin dioxygenase-like cupin family protein
LWNVSFFAVDSSRRQIKDYGGSLLSELGKVIMSDTSVKKIDSTHSPKGQLGQKYLASGKSLSMRLWEDEQPNADKEPSSRDYETVGYVINGRAELHIEGQMILLEPGSSWVVPKGASHTYKILEPFTAVEATSPPAQVHGRDEN